MYQARKYKYRSFSKIVLITENEEQLKNQHKKLIEATKRIGWI